MTQATSDEDYWSADDFEDTVARALILCYESKVKRNRGAAPTDRMTPERLVVIRRLGPYIPSPSRLLHIDDDGGKCRGIFDVTNDPLPPSGLVAFKLMEGSYLDVFHFRQTSTLGKYWHRLSGGTLYEAMFMHAEDTGVNGDRVFFTVTKDGSVLACTQKIPNRDWGYKLTILEPDAKWLNEISVWGAVALQYQADRRFCWTITAQEKEAKAHLGCMREEVKSLLYARTLPLSATGRKRPILHLVEAHKRRMRSGIDVDINSFLRGQQTVEISGTVFTVNPPVSLRVELSQKSARYFQTSQEGT